MPVLVLLPLAPELPWPVLSTWPVPLPVPGLTVVPLLVIVEPEGVPLPEPLPRLLSGAGCCCTGGVEAPGVGWVADGGTKPLSCTGWLACVGVTQVVQVGGWDGGHCGYGPLEPFVQCGGGGGDSGQLGYGPGDPLLHVGAGGGG